MGGARGGFAEQLSSATRTERAGGDDRAPERQREESPSSQAAAESQSNEQPDPAEQPEADATANTAEDTTGERDTAEQSSVESENHSSARDEITEDESAVVDTALPIEFVNAEPIAAVVEPGEPAAESAPIGEGQEAANAGQQTDQGEQQPANFAGLELAAAELSRTETTDAETSTSSQEQAESQPSRARQSEQAEQQPTDLPPQVAAVDKPSGELTGSQSVSQSAAETELDQNQVAQTKGGDGQTDSEQRQSGHRQNTGEQQTVGSSSTSPEPNEQTLPAKATVELPATETIERVETAEPATSTTPADDSQRPDNNSPFTRLAAGRLSSGRSAENAEQTSTPRVDAGRFVTRVSRAIETAQQRGGEIKLRLSPPELGTLQIKLTLSEGALTATLETETASARNLLLDNLPALRDRLAEQQIRVEKFDVDVRQEGGQQQEWTPGDRNERQGDDHRTEPELPASERPDQTNLQDPLATISIDSTNPQTINLVV